MTIIWWPKVALLQLCHYIFQITDTTSKISSRIVYCVIIHQNTYKGFEYFPQNFCRDSKLFLPFEYNPCIWVHQRDCSWYWLCGKTNNCSESSFLVIVTKFSTWQSSRKNSGSKKELYAPSRSWSSTYFNMFDDSHARTRCPTLCGDFMGSLKQRAWTFFRSPHIAVICASHRIRLKAPDYRNDCGIVRWRLNSYFLFYCGYSFIINERI